MDPEWTLAAGPLRCTVSPFGASLRRLWVEEPAGPRDVLWGYSGTAGKRGGQGDILAPFPGRVRGGAYTFAGQGQQLRRNDKEGPNAIHGFLRARPWEGGHGAAHAHFRTRIVQDGQAGYPFDLDVAVGYELTEGGLACAFVARNVGDAPAPFGAGFHPYVLCPGAGGVDGTVLRSPAAELVEFDGLLPTGRVVPVPPGLDFRAPRPVGPLRLNHCFTGLERDPDGFARVRIGDAEVWMGPAFGHLVLYTGDALGPDARRALAVEPMTCATDAFNHPDDPAWGLRVLEPGEAFSGTWGVGLAR